MNKFLKVSLFSLGFILIAWTAGRVTGALQRFKAPTPSNYPSIKIGSSFFVSNLIKPKRFDFICYHAEVLETKIIAIHRLCGMEGDVVEIRNGTLFVNGVNADSDLTLAHRYKISNEDFIRLNGLESEEILMPGPRETDVTTVNISDEVIHSLKIVAEKVIINKNEEDTSISRVFSAPQNQDNFGPITVPAGKYFVLGDNRLNALDSRYLGFIDQKEYVGTKLNW